MFESAFQLAMRAKEKRIWILVFTIFLLNVVIYIYKQHTPTTSADILRQPAVIEKLGPPLPSEELENQLAQKRLNKQPVHNVSHTNRSRKSPYRLIHLKPKSVTDKFLFYSYLRAGGSKVAETLNLHHQDVFYLHHPLYNIEDVGPDYGMSKFPGPQSDDAIKLLRGMYNCSFKAPNNLYEPLLWKSHSVRDTYRKQCQLFQMDLPSCLELACKKRPLKAVFTLRLDLRYIHRLLQIYRNTMKVIIVIRDPRSILSVRRNDKIGFQLDSVADFRNQASLLCQNMAADLDFIDEISKKHKGAIKVLRLEHLMLHPSDVLTYLYDFMGLEVSSAQILNIINILQLNHPEDQRQLLTKGWQVELTLQESRAVDLGCEPHYKKLGYFPVPQSIDAQNKYFITWDQAKEIR